MSDSPIIGGVDFAQVKGCLRLLQSLCLATLWILLVGFWGYLANKQVRGDFRPKSVYIQLGDKEIPYLGLYSDIYDQGIPILLRG